MIDQRRFLELTLGESIQVKKEFIHKYGHALCETAQYMANCLRAGGKILICGNGGSAADAQHMAAELVGRMLVERRPLAAMALTTDSSILTAVGNDYGYDHVFERQVEALGKPGDILVAITTSGNSRNVCLAADKARSIGMLVVGLTGGDGGKIRRLSNVFLCAEHAHNSARCQETHGFVVHSLVDLLDKYYLVCADGNDLPA